MAKYIVLALTLALSFNALAKNQTTAAQIEKAVNLISHGAQGGAHKTVLTPSNDPKEILKEYAWVTAQIPPEDFKDNWASSDSEAWEADSGAWALTDLAKAKKYIKSSLQDWRDNKLSDADEAAYQQVVNKAKEGFDILVMSSSVAYGVTPTGAVQCGVTFAALVVIDLENGIVYNISMEDSGC